MPQYANIILTIRPCFHKLYKKAIEIYKKILERFNENLNIMLSLTKCYIMDKDKENACCKQ